MAMTVLDMSSVYSSNARGARVVVRSRILIRGMAEEVITKGLLLR